MNYAGTKEVKIELTRLDANIWEDSDGDPLPISLSEWVEEEAMDDTATLTIEVTYSGSYTPAYTTGAPEDCYPEDGEEERDFHVPSLSVGDIGSFKNTAALVPDKLLKDDETKAYFWDIVNSLYIDSADYSEEI
jgi:hypothetical protein